MQGKKRDQHNLHMLPSHRILTASSTHHHPQRLKNWPVYHPNVCHLQDAVDRGWLLSEASHFTGVVRLTRLLLTALELATALAFLHGMGIMHGDLTGGNVLLQSAPVTPTDPRGFIVKVQLLQLGLSPAVTRPDAVSVWLRQSWWWHLNDVCWFKTSPRLVPSASVLQIAVYKLPFVP